jgi:phosphoribosyl 1,2-cyclic phosphate phosphodiesterase
MKITILGSGSAYGSPRAGNYAGDCDLSNEKNTRLRSSFYLEDGADRLLVECGPDFRQQMNKYGVSKFKNIFISHGHTDHIGGIWELTNWVNVWNKNINIYGDKDTLNEVKVRFPFMFKDDFKEIVNGGVSLNLIEDKKSFTPKNSNMELLPLKYIHNSEYSFGFRYKDFIFTPDLEYIPNATAKYMENAELWLVECDSVVDAHNSHNNIAQSLEWAKKYKPRRMILNHLDVTVDYEKVSKMLPNGVELAFDGMVIEL